MKRRIMRTEAHYSLSPALKGDPAKVSALHQLAFPQMYLIILEDSTRAV